MKLFTAMLASILAMLASVHADWQSSYDSLLQKYVKPEGIPYKTWQANRADRTALKKVVNGVASQNLKGMNKDQKLAFYLNAYNAWILHTVIENYPVKSIKDIRFLVFRRNSIKVAGKVTSFHKLENDIIRKQFKEPRIHFALNCASASCPPLHHRAFTAEELEVLLQKLAKSFATTPIGHWSRGGLMDVHVSKIFDWYENDFKEDAGSILGYLAKVRGEPYPKGAQLSFQEYDWSLNEIK